MEVWTFGRLKGGLKEGIWRDGGREGKRDRDIDIDIEDRDRRRQGQREKERGRCAQELAPGSRSTRREKDGTSYNIST